MGRAERVFVCDLTKHPEMKAVFTEFDERQDKNIEKAKFVQKQFDALKEENQKNWRFVWDRAVELGLIDKNKKWDDWDMELIADRTQLMIRDNRTGGIPEELRAIFGSFELKKDE